MSKTPFKLAVLISGGGTTLMNLFEKIEAGQLPHISVSLVVSSSQSAGGLRHAKSRGVPTVIARKHSDLDDHTYSGHVFDPIRAAGVDLVVMGGFLKHVLIPEDFHQRVINIHPSLIPAFSGQGFYGLRVHRAVLEKGCKVTGCTVHFVDNEYDHGPIIAQEVVPVAADDTPESLQKRVFQAECEVYPRVIQSLATADSQS